MSYSPMLVSRIVPSALQSLTSVFEMGTGVSSMLLSPVSFRKKTRLLKQNKSYKTKLIKPSNNQYYLAEYIAVLTPVAYQRRSLQRFLLSYDMRNLILGWASCLYAFSAYPFQTQLPSNAFDKTTGRPEVCPLRSSRTRSRFLQISYAHSGQRPNCLTTF